MLRILTATVFSLGLIGAAGAASASTIVYSDNFNSDTVGNTPAGFTDGSVVTAPSGEQFLAIYNPDGGATYGYATTLGLSGLTPGSTATLSFRLDVVGSMDGDGSQASSGSGGVIAGGGSGDFFNIAGASGSTSSTLFNYAFANYGDGETQGYPTPGSAPGAGAVATNSLGYSGFPSDAGIQDAVYDFTLAPVTVSADGSASFTFTSYANEGASNEFYGIDNVSVASSTGSVTAVPEPASLAVLGMGLLGLAGLRRRNRG